MLHFVLECYGKSWKAFHPFKYPDHYQGSLPARYFASKSSAPDEIESLPRSEIKAVRFKIEAVEIKIEAVEIKTEAVEICLRGNSTEVANSTNIHVQTYKSLTEAQLLKEEEQLQDKENKLLDEKNKLLDLLLEEKNSRGSGGKASYLAFLLRLLFLNLVPRWISQIMVKPGSSVETATCHIIPFRDYAV